MDSKTENNFEIPENFKTTTTDFVNDLSTTFPEFKEKWDKLLTDLEINDKLQEIFKHCLHVYPERFFDLLYQSDELFATENTTNTFFLPEVDFKELFHIEGVSDATKKTMWKYLQLILFSLIGSVKDKENFGNSMNMFEGIEEDELQSKMKETLDSIGDFFNNVGDSLDKETEEGDAPTESSVPSEEKEEFTFDKTQGMPNLNDLHEHLKGLFDGKIGSLAKNIAEEISGDFEKLLGEDYKDVRSTKDVFQKMMRNPQKMMELVKKVGDKIKARMDSGEISKDDIMSEAGEILRKMKEMGGGNDDKLKEMLQNMAKNMGMGKNAKVDMNAVNRMTKQEAMRQRLRNKLNAKRGATVPETPAANYVLEQTGDANYVFKMPNEGTQMRSSIPTKIVATPKYTDAELIAEFDKPVVGEPTQPKKKDKKAKKKK